MRAGNSKVLEFTVTDDDGAPEDISGATLIRWQLARSVAGPALLEKETGDGVVIVNGPQGRFDVLLEPEDTAALRGDYYNEAKLVDGSGRQLTVELTEDRIRVELALMGPEAG